jgi:hypothetical protein
MDFLSLKVIYPVHLFESPARSKKVRAPTNVHSKIGLKDNDFWWKYVKIKEQA